MTESVTAADVRTMLERGTPRSEILAQLRGTGVWSDAGAHEIVRFMTSGPDEWLSHHLTLVGHAPTVLAGRSGLDGRRVA